MAQWNEGRRGRVFDLSDLDTWDPLDLTAYSSKGEVRLKVPLHIRVDWLETDHAHIFKANLPGLTKEDVKIQVEEGLIFRISGESKKDEVDKNNKWHCIERQHGTFSRSFRLPENAMLDQVKANMTHGVLTVTIPKTAESKPKAISIDISEN